LVSLGEFLEDHFPLPDGNVKKKQVSLILAFIIAFEFLILMD
jgi:hypothetical protein